MSFKPHPIAEVVVRIARDGPDDTLWFAEEDLRLLEEAADGFVGSDELVDVVETLLVAAHLIEIERASPEAAEQLVAICERPSILAALRRQNDEREAASSEAVAEAADRFQRFTGKSAPEVTPEPEPEGTVKLAQFNFPKRL